MTTNDRRTTDAAASRPGTLPRGARWAVAVAGVALVAAGVVALAWPHDASAGALHDLAGNAVALEPGTAPAPAQRATMDPVDDTGARFAVPAVGLDVPLGTMTPADGQITPPGFTSAYVVRDLGVTPEAATEGTVFVVMHSLRDGAVGPGNYLIDVAEASARVHTGDEIEVGGTTYAVTGSREITKPDIADDAAVWADEPGRLVVITCLQRPGGGPSYDNVVITAQRVEG
ncbi:class F sortase [Microbacterium sp. KR10-403]|uniref:class F sortase n=1 Tax=Microbacterium sp. KR10-403 TaxID=3158581 RepID=UPI0032E3C39B